MASEVKVNRQPERNEWFSQERLEERAEDAEAASLILMKRAQLRAWFSLESGESFLKTNHVGHKCVAADESTRTSHKIIFQTL